MSFNGLAQFASFLESRGQLARVACRVDPHLEITEIADRLVKNGGSALLFEDTGTNFPLLINAFASDERMAAAMGRASLDDAGEEIFSLVESLGRSRGRLTRLARLPGMIRFLTLAPRRKRGRGECQEVVDHTPDLSRLPILKCWPHDGGRFITLPLVHTRHPDTGRTNLGMYRMQVMGKDVTGMHWHRHKTGARHFEAWKKKGGRMPVTVTLGGDPVYTYSATAPLPEDISEYLLAAFLRRKRVKLVRCLTNDLWVPADSDFVIEGYVDTSEPPVTEGPFGDHTGFYSLADLYPRFRVTCITHRKNAVYPATVVGVPPMEDAWMGKATEKIFFAPIKLTIAPEIRELHMPVSGVAHNLVIVSIDKTYPGQGMKVLSALFGAGQMMLSKYIIVVNSDVHVTDYLSVAEAFFANVRFETDLLLTRGPLDVLDHSSDRFSMGGKLGIDATVKLSEERVAESHTMPMMLLTDDEITNRYITGLKTMAQYALPVAVLTISKPDTGLDMHRMASSLPASLTTPGTVIIAVDDGADADDPAMLTWLVTGNSDPARDLYHLDGGALFIDATSKVNSLPAFPREWPNVVCSDPETIQLTDRRWPEYGLGPLIASPSLKLLPLLRPGNASVETSKATSG
ncbi:MAG: menaquinone biosynthesis decarboxylase [Bacteroidales bacterium]|jgi:4-hydroxy-3-polyprenylbenzoate decarboxylase|nr:menaquinone biosynthesis decarboxylase [Bacteroidales bacterium]NLD63477.1 menaquinone biosynthesis decarboxylase [Bacteroidales bacterium]HNT93392.1 menaquinone biosynthesis decarboxylase [Bacteroidales bacterium]HOO66430.1 menaquinone biosynthesis decarboxylase [Bacteroidales bacterium]HPE22533.1 menaquinone biosynthesis decarboxylase [Bacteroidales bacterium]